ncbi:MAG: sensor histidine kinase [Chloroflexales bacterium]|nr:sensor histidine kinase [Chloroflexales bacterium]
MRNIRQIQRQALQHPSNTVDWFPHRWQDWLAPRPFDWVSSFIYLGVLVDFITFHAGGQSSAHTPGMITAILTLLALDRWQYWRYGEEPPTYISVIFFILRIILIETVVQLNDLELSTFLYILLPFIASMDFGLRAGYAMGALVWLVFMFKMASFGADLELIWSNTTVFTMGIVFALTMARVVSRERFDRRRAEQLLIDLEHSHQQLSAYATQSAELATVTERNRLARDIHDSLGHYLIGMKIQLEKAHAFYDWDAAESKRSIQDAQRLAQEVLDDVRRSVGMLRSTEPSFSLKDALVTLVEPLRNDRFTVALTVDGEERAFPLQIRLALYRGAQEGLTNIQRHARASHATIVLRFAVDQAILQITDDGVGFWPDDIAQAGFVGSNSYGLRGLQERFELMGGSMQIESRPGAGTVLTIVAPREGLSRRNERHIETRGTAL